MSDFVGDFLKILKILRLLKISLRFVVFNKHQQGGNKDNPSLCDMINLRLILFRRI